MLQARIQQAEGPFLGEISLPSSGLKILQESGMKDTFLRNISLPSSGSMDAPSKNPAGRRPVSRRNIASIFRAGEYFKKPA
jgi:hypothetical protein